ncbi:DUF6194 family protein [Naasia lichenicola]|uniref:DUF6194 domain-containing protein n=1 Tax=Naasia lichenicola TaxID=2565933 RepID=A0A4S4FIR6_9MICO|nr:DUF6194 family protein [Naasia lichenicola]THG29978.1 hypothetical protein E6C64_15150 [Naasia lichenicola]
MSAKDSTLEQILETIRGFDGVLELAPGPGSEHPEISWGDHFFYYAPDGRVPTNRQPYATIVTKDYPDDVGSRLSAADRWRLNIHVGMPLFTELLGYPPDAIQQAAIDFSETDVFLPHPLYGAFGWVCIVDPAARTTDRAIDAFAQAHRADRRRVVRRDGGGPASAQHD